MRLETLLPLGKVEGRRRRSVAGCVDERYPEAVGARTNRELEAGLDLRMQSLSRSREPNHIALLPPTAEQHEGVIANRRPGARTELAHLDINSAEQGGLIK